jgi:hypothetical protein
MSPICLGSLIVVLPLALLGLVSYAALAISGRISEQEELVHRPRPALHRTGAAAYRHVRRGRVVRIRRLQTDTMMHARRSRESGVRLGLAGVLQRVEDR